MWFTIMLNMMSYDWSEGLWYYPHMALIVCGVRGLRRSSSTEMEKWVQKQEHDLACTYQIIVYSSLSI